MKKLLLTLIISLAATLFVVGPVNAHVVDETTRKSAQNYSDLYTKVQEYKGNSGVTIVSYSPMWNTVDKLKAIETELLSNKHGEELKLLGKVEIYPDYPAGKQVLGQYFSQYQTRNGNVSLLPDRKIALYGGNEHRTIDSIATTLSHEYGHHVTFYHILHGENKLPNEWLQSEYAKLRDFANTRVHSDYSGEYNWMIHELAAEDYVQLFGSERAIKNHTQLNATVGNPFDTPSVKKYYETRWGMTDTSENLSIFLLDYEKNNLDPSYYNLKLRANGLDNKKTFLKAQESTGTYTGVLLDELINVQSNEKWYKATNYQSNRRWIFDSFSNPTINVKLLQHEQEGFNRGSATLVLNYNSLEDSKVNEKTLNLQSEPSFAEKKRLLQEAAEKYNIPADILKAIAWVETGMRQFEDDGTPIISDDGGIGMMQVTITDDEMRAKGISRERLETDTAYNIEVGAQILNEKWSWAGNRIPKINDHNRNIIEHWYFAVMAYNGLSRVNDPATNSDAYQERVWGYIRDNSLMKIKDIPSFEVNLVDGIMHFPVKQYNWPELNTKTTQHLRAGDMVYSYNEDLRTSNVRNGVDGSIIYRAPHYTPFKIVEGPFHPTANASNHYVMYKVEGPNGLNGYISSGVILEANVKIFSDLRGEELISAVAYMNNLGIINGFENGTFRPNQQLERRHAAAFLIRALNLELPEGYTRNDKELKPGDLGYNEMTIVEAHGLMGQGSNYNPTAPLTRAQMAQILTRAFGPDGEGYYKVPATNHQFNDVKQSSEIYPYVNMLYGNGITISDPYNPYSPVTRGQFALFLMRTLALQ